MGLANTKLLPGVKRDARARVTVSPHLKRTSSCPETASVDDEPDYIEPKLSLFKWNRWQL